MDIALFTTGGLDFLLRWGHFMAGITWIGLLYYFNFVQTEYFKEAEDTHRSGAIQKLVPRALWWFRWGAMFTFLTGLYLLHLIGATMNFMGMPLISIGALAGTFMFLNVWLIIWPKQKVVLGLKEGDGPSSAAKAGLASRTNTLLSAPMLFGMLGSKYLYAGDFSNTAIYVCFAIIVLLEVNGIFGKTGPITSVKGVIHCSLGLTALLWAILAFV